MSIAVIGAGNMGRAIACRLVTGGHDVLLADEDTAKAESVAAEIAPLGGGTVRAAPARDAADIAGIVVLATLYDVSTRVAAELSELLDGKIVVDISNPFNGTFNGLTTPEGSSAGEEIARRVPGARVVKAFNTTFAPVLFAGTLDETPIDVLLASDDDGAKDRVARIVKSGRLRPIDAGALANSRTLERITLLLVDLQGRYELDFQATLRFLPGRVEHTTFDPSLDAAAATG